MSPRNRRAFLSLATTAAATSIAGCSQVFPGTGPRTDDDDDLPTTAPPGSLVDDWQYDPSQAQGDSGGNASGSSGGSATAMATSTQSGGSVGLAAGGAKDVNNFRQNVEEGYLPIPSDLSYEGLFYDYYFDTGSSKPCESLFCPSYSPAVTADPLSGETERYLSVGLNSGLDASDFDRKRLNLVVVLDISGSMGSPFSQYYYDQYGNKQEVEDAGDRPKIEVAKDALASLTEQLRPGDRFGVVLYNGTAAVAKPMNPVEQTDMEAIRGHIKEDIRATGGTNLSAGLSDASKLLEEYRDADQTTYENRMIVLTDAMPNIGETSADSLEDRLAREAENNVHSTFVGIGVDFNSEIIDQITSVRGANYYSVHSAKQFEERVTDGFEYMVTPLVFDLSLELDADGYDIEKVYGSSAAEEATGELMQVNTLFASPTSEGKTKGGVVLVKVKKTGDAGQLRLRASWEDRTGKSGNTETTIQFPDGGPEQFANSGVRKAVLLTRYADLMKNWMVAERESGGDPPAEGIEVPEYELGEWERQSDPLTVSTEYRQRFATFSDYFETEMTALGDDALQQELDVLRKLAGESAAARLFQVLSPRSRS
ncbi:VWA domain-containing protein [Haloarchaeobius sp. HME9146]|uniref:vWA domain-containing protein n=1 Tax=Haloarchaeobius sp. HME9146 TaxID=2978732 RepID=UPI0021C0ED96|nr:VWA domain-containing protein [Haloarchaeobius sp. HME9146]MCT9094787.1 VWA domain-containing protein [Haloarchaeobius sp. HME9146]